VWLSIWSGIRVIHAETATGVKHTAGVDTGTNYLRNQFDSSQIRILQIAHTRPPLLLIYD